MQSNCECGGRIRTYDIEHWKLERSMKLILLILALAFGLMSCHSRPNYSRSDATHATSGDHSCRLCSCSCYMAGADGKTCMNHDDQGAMCNHADSDHE